MQELVFARATKSSIDSAFDTWLLYTCREQRLREIEALRQVILQLGGAAAEAQVPRHSAARVLSPRANAPLAKTPPGLPPGHSGLAGNGSPISPHRRTKLEVRAYAARTSFLCNFA